jgi:Fe-Mn family superoxide dismutase
MGRRDVLKGLAAGAAVLTVRCNGSTGGGAAPRRPGPPPRAQGGPFQLPKLPYALGALEPHISRRTLGFHYGKHHLGYVNKLNKAVKGTALAAKTLPEVIRATAGKADQQGVFNNAAQAFNHAFYWQSLKPGGGGDPTGDLAARIKSDFGSIEACKKALFQAGATQFGSGWAWLILDGAKLAVRKTANADTPLAQGKTPLLTIDVWEHAYYLDYQNRRKAYLKTVLDKLLNWEFAARNLQAG